MESKIWRNFFNDRNEDNSIGSNPVQSEDDELLSELELESIAGGSIYSYAYGCTGGQGCI